jgi:hypothetical protein
MDKTLQRNFLKIASNARVVGTDVAKYTEQCQYDFRLTKWKLHARDTAVPRDTGTHFLVRTCVDRLASHGSHTIAAEMAEVAVIGHHRVEIGDGTTVSVTLRTKRIHVLPPIGKQKRYPALDLTAIHAREDYPPEGRPAIDWKLITDLPVLSPDDAVRMLVWYAMCWKIEVFHKILKSGCRAEDARLRTDERLVNLIAIFCVLACRLSG